ncbi:hypothetical protein [Pseudomonas sp. SST3]|uniref:hypothetical protein n=1 Tax=Pseudomonas sp. SST3 TaxID=2267882 RepID=UPI001443D640|nr:hypothetical protein [Pseudomonas sp. SST3]NKQ13294.1 hypothetical protein [Pseudomonas sp. SST3]
MTTERNRPLHLHTLDSLCSDLVAGLLVSVGEDGSTFQLQSSASRGVLLWYAKNKLKWTREQHLGKEAGLSNFQSHMFRSGRLSLRPAWAKRGNPETATARIERQY